MDWEWDEIILWVVAALLVLAVLRQKAEEQAPSPKPRPAVAAAPAVDWEQRLESKRAEVLRTIREIRARIQAELAR